MYITKPLVIIIVCFVLALILGGGLVWPKYQSLRSVQAEISQKTMQLQVEKDYFFKVEAVSAEIGKNKPDMAKIDSALPKDVSSPSLLNFLQDVSSQSGLVLVTLGSSVSSRVSGEDTRETKLNFQVSGSYADFKNFLAALENSARIINVEMISFSSPRDPKDGFRFNLTITTNSY